MSDLMATLLILAAVCLSAWSVMAYVLWQGDWWRP